MTNRNALVSVLAAAASIAGLGLSGQSARAGVIDSIVSKLVDSAAKDAVEGGSRAIGNIVNPGGNIIDGNVVVVAESKTGTIVAIASIVNVGSVTISKSEIHGNVDITLKAETKSITAIASVVDVASVQISGGSKIGKNLKVDLNAKTGDIVAIGSQVGVASLSITGTTIGGGVDVRSHVETGSITAIGSSVNVGNIRF